MTRTDDGSEEIEDAERDSHGCPNDPLAQELLRPPLLGHLAYTGCDGFPWVIPIGFLWRGSDFVVCTATNAPKVRALAKNPKVAFTINTNAQPPHVLLVRGTASVEVVDGVPSEFLEASQKALPRAQWPAFEAQVRGIYDQMARITIVPEWAKLLDFETRLPRAVQELMSEKR